MSAFFYNVGDQCSSHKKLNTNAPADCQQLVHNNNATKRLECHIRYQSFYNCRKEWCKYLGVCLNQTKSWWFHFNCIWKFKYYRYFRITVVPRGKDRPLLTIDVKLCKTIYYRYSLKYKLFTIKINEHESGMGNITNGLYKLVFQCLIDIKFIFGLDCRADFVFH